MKKIIFSVIFIFCILCCGNASRADGDLWDNFGDHNFYGNKAVSQKDFDNAIKVKKGEKKPKKQKGEVFQQDNDTEAIKQKSEELPVITVTVPIKVGDDAVLPIGHYQVMSEKRGNRIVLKLYQGHYLLAEFDAIETLDDFDQPEINFASFIAEENNTYKLIYGSIDYNAYVELTSAE